MTGPAEGMPCHPDGERHRISIHESGHIVTAWTLGRRVVGISVVPGKRWAGSSHFGVARTSARSWGRLDPTRPLAMWPAQVRRTFETKALITAAGDAAEHVLWWPAQHMVRTPDRLSAQVADAAPLSDAERLRLAAAEAESGGRSDLATLEGIAELMYRGPDNFAARMAWLRWVDAEAERIVTQGAEHIERLATVVADRGRLGAKAIRGILEGP